MRWNIEKPQQSGPFQIASPDWKQTGKMRCRRIKHVARRKILSLVTAMVYCYYIFTLRNVGTCDESDYLYTYLPSVRHSYYWPHVFYLQHQTQEPVNQSLVSSAARALIINLSYFLPTTDALYIA